jgi:polysaccharide biosynthesis protein PslH
VEYHIMGQYLPALAGCPAPRVLVQHEPGTTAALVTGRAHKSAGRLLPYLDRLAWRRFEPAVMKQVQTVVVFTERDQRALAALRTSTPIARIGFGTIPPERALDPLGQPPLSLLFVGNFVHAPNVDAAERLVRDIFPRLQAHFPALLLYIVGSHPPPSLANLASTHVRITGHVPDVRPYLDRAAVVVLPVRLGGGMRVKAVEALAAGKAIVASPLAVEGLDLAHEKQCLLATSDEEFAQAVARLLREPELRSHLAKAARAWACANLGWARPVSDYQGLYDRLLSISHPQ